MFWQEIMECEGFNLNELWSRLIVEEFVRNGIDYFCISPGSRSTPLVAAIARNMNTKKMICFDERGSAFHALGYAQATGKPAVVITTSGTAVANLLPAVVEAHQNTMPMILLTADRPHELLDIGANQTINQTNIFGVYTKWHFCFPCPDKNIALKMVLSTIDYAIYSSLDQPSGPVHINCMFREPLEPDRIEANIKDLGREDTYLNDIEKWFKNDKPYISYNIPKTTAGNTEIKTIADIINTEEKGLVSVGRLGNEDDIVSVLNFIKKTNWPVYADITSGLRLDKYIGSNMIKHFDQTIMSQNLNMKASPGTVVHFGGKITSKRFNQFFDQNKPRNYIVIKNNPTRYNPSHIVTMHIEADVFGFCKNICNLIKSKNENYFKDFYENKAFKIRKIIDRHIKDEDRINEVFVSRQISNLIPGNSCLFLSNSMPIRDMELYGCGSDKKISIGTNRGVSGIDGIISSAIGFSAGNKKLCTLLIGDLAFLHDLNALATVSSIKYPIIIVLINNNGGGIFHFLPISECKDILEDYFVTPHNLSFEGAAEIFKINYFNAQTCGDFTDVYKNSIKIAQEKNRSSLIEVTTDRKFDLKLRRKIKIEILKMLED